MSDSESYSDDYSDDVDHFGKPSPPSRPAPAKEVGRSGDSASRSSVSPSLQSSPSPSPPASAQDNTVAAKNAENRRLRNELMELNKELDDALNRRGERIPQIGRIRPERRDNPEADKLQRDIEKVRKDNEKLQDKLRITDVSGQLLDLQNQLNDKVREVEALKEENRSLQNIHHHQATRLTSIADVEARITAAHQKHLGEMHEIKKRMTELKNRKEQDDSLIKQQQNQLNNLQIKLKAVQQGRRPPTSPEAIVDLETKVEEKEKQVERLRYQVRSLTKTNEGEKKKLHQQMKGTSQELRDLQDEAERLRKLLIEKNSDPFPISSSSAMRYA